MIVKISWLYYICISYLHNTHVSGDCQIYQICKHFIF